jgi:hypothetical protein
MFTAQACCALLAARALWYTLQAQNKEEDRLNNLINDVGRSKLVTKEKGDDSA